MKIILNLSRIFAGLVFVFSGFVKGIDPTGFAIKFEEYFQAFNLDFLVPLALPLAVLLSAAEFMIGLNLLTRVGMRLTAWLLLVFMSFFTVLTFVLALTNPVTDCGCFGDAIKLTNWQTFGKNVILLVPTLIIFLGRKHFIIQSSRSIEWILALVNFTIPVFLSVFCLLHQPLMDFRPYKTGTHIPAGMVVPDGAPVDQYETILIYEKNGVRQEFSESDFPWQDSTWKWVETRQKLISSGYEPPIHDFSITTSDGEDLTEKILSDSNYVWLIIAPKLESSSAKGLQHLNDLARKAYDLGMPVYYLTSSATSEVDLFKNQFNPPFEICLTDETTLKTIIRANPGLLLLHKGTILAKWNHRDAPVSDDLQNNPLSLILNKQRSMIELLAVMSFALLAILILIRIRS